MTDDQLTELAFQLADSTASSDIETLCAPVGGEPKSIEEIRTCWFDLTQIRDSVDIPLVEKSVAYLDRRGLLERHPTHYHWVRPRH